MRNLCVYNRNSLRYEYVRKRMLSLVLRFSELLLLRVELVGSMILLLLLLD